MTEPVQSQNTLLRSVRDQAKAWINRVRVSRAQFASGLPQTSVGVGPFVELSGSTVTPYQGADVAVSVVCLCHDAPALGWSNKGTLATHLTHLTLTSGAGLPQVVEAASSPGEPCVVAYGDRLVRGFAATMTFTAQDAALEGGYLCNTPVVNGRCATSFGARTPSNPDWQSCWMRYDQVTESMIDDGYEFTSGTIRYRIIGLWWPNT